MCGVNWFLRFLRCAGHSPSPARFCHNPAHPSGPRPPRPAGQGAPYLFRFGKIQLELVNIYNILYIAKMSLLKPVVFQGSALSDLREFPLTARRDAGHQLDQVQQGLEPDDWKPMNTVGQGVREIRIRDESGVFRVIYVAKFSDAVYVLHCFQKRSQKTSQQDLDLATKRYRDLVKELA
jgi:phage-related protein